MTRGLIVRNHQPRENMISLRFGTLLLFLYIQWAHNQEVHPTFRAKDTIIEMGYCFGVDYIVVYRCTSEGDQLLGNSSDNSVSFAPPADLRGRIHTNKKNHLLGLQIHDLTLLDSGIYRRECWKNQTLINHHTYQLFVCDEESGYDSVVSNEVNGAFELVCNGTSIGQEGSSVRWYYEMHPSYNLKLLLDNSASLRLLVDELQGMVEVRKNGSILLLSRRFLKNNLMFSCLVMKETKCLSFQNIFLSVMSEKRDIFVSQGDRVQLNCPFESNNQQWETPLGNLNGSSTRISQMHISVNDKSGNFSLVIPSVSDEHSGEYSCMAPLLEVKYSLNLCPQKPPKEVFLSEDENILLKCDADQDNPEGVQWYREGPGGAHELIHDSNDNTVPIPEDLRGRMTPSENGSTLMISGTKLNDRNVYWCVLFGFYELLEDRDDYDDTYDFEYEDEYEDENDEDEDDNSQLWYGTSCLFKQENILLLTKRSTSDNSVSALGAGLGALLVLAIVVTIVVVVARARSSKKLTDKKMKVDPGCTEGLTSTAPCDP